MGVVQIELAVDDLPGFRVARGRIALGDRPGAIAAILRRIARRVREKGVPIGGRREPPLRPVILSHKIPAALHRPALGEIGDSVIAGHGPVRQKRGINRILRESRRRHHRQRARHHQTPGQQNHVSVTPNSCPPFYGHAETRSTTPLTPLRPTVTCRRQTVDLPFPAPPPSPGQVIAMAEIVGCPPTPLLILTGWLPRLDTSAPVAGPKRYRRSTLYQRVGDPGWGVYDDTDPAQVAALRLRYVLLGEGFPAVAMGQMFSQ